MTEITPPKIEPDVLNEKISAKLEQNGTTEWEKLLVYYIQNMDAKLDKVINLAQEVHLLKKRNIWIWCEKHQKIFFTVVLAVVVLFIIHFAELWPAVEKAAEVAFKYLL